MELMFFFYAVTSVGEFCIHSAAGISCLSVKCMRIRRRCSVDVLFLNHTGYYPVPHTIPPETSSAHIPT